MAEVVPTTIIDRFFETPSLVRKYAQSLEYYPCTEHPNRGYWPGKRTKLLQDLDPVLHEIICRKIIRYLPSYRAFEIADAAFHISTGECGSGWIHTDDDHLGIGGVIYLNPDMTEDSGTTIYDVPAGAEMQGYEEEFHKAMEAQGTEAIANFDKYKEQCNSYFNESIKVQARYNRAILFDGRKYHGGQNFYGSTSDDARLTLVFFGRGINDYQSYDARFEG